MKYEELEARIPNAEVVDRTPKAVKVVAKTIGEVWVPQSVITDNSEVWEPGQEPGDLVVAYWFAKKNGWI